MIGRPATGGDVGLLLRPRGALGLLPRVELAVVYGMCLAAGVLHLGRVWRQSR